MKNWESVATGEVTKWSWECVFDFSVKLSLLEDRCGSWAWSWAVLVPWTLLTSASSRQARTLCSPVDQARKAGEGRAQFWVCIHEELEKHWTVRAGYPQVLVFLVRSLCLFWLLLACFLFLITQVQTKWYRACIVIFTVLNTHARFCSLGWFRWWISLQ